MALEKQYSNYQVVGKKFEAAAYNEVVSQLEAAAPNTQSSVANDICVECFFNNCSECCDECLENPAPNDGGGGAGNSECKSACNDTRISDRNISEIEVIAEFSMACPGISWGAAEVGACLGPQGAVIGGVCAYIGCGSLAYLRYLNNMSKSESTYVNCLYGCK